MDPGPRSSRADGGAYPDTIVAVATAHGAGGVGIVRLSGALAPAIATAVCGVQLHPRRARHVVFRAADGEAIDDGIALYFEAPRSYTGDDVVELQAHGSPVLLARLQRACIALGARAARPGEFTERAFLAGKLDLAQAEAVADLISAGSEAAARAARRSLDGEFSQRVHALVEQLIELRMYVEAALDFPDEEIDFLGAPALAARVQAARNALAGLLAAAQQGKRLMDGLHAVILGAPNVGKSSLLNALAREDRAIVSDIAGTTRDLLRESIELDGLRLTLVDTAGLRVSPDAIEAEGMRRARAELQRADLVLAMLVDGDTETSGELVAALEGLGNVLWLHNKADLHPRAASTGLAPGRHLWLSARTGEGLEALRDCLREQAGGEGGGSFSARTRHLEALALASRHLDDAALRLDSGDAELCAEELRQAHTALGEITGPVDTDVLLGRIFAGFCIGK